MVEKWHYSWLNRSLISPVFTVKFSLPSGWRFGREIYSVLSVLIGQSMLHVLATTDVGMSKLAICALCSDSPLPATYCLQVTLSVGSSSSSLLCCKFPRNHFVLVQTGLKTESDNKLNKMRASTKKIAAELSPNKSHATTNVGLLAH